MRVRTPVRRLVWAGPCSLAATGGIAFAYLDVSVPRVAFLTLWIHVRIIGHHSNGVFLFGDPRVDVCLRLNAAFRSLPRPSSALSAKASTACPLFLDLLRSVILFCLSCLQV